MNRVILFVGVVLVLLPAVSFADAGYALQFDGVDDYVNIPGNVVYEFGNGDFTFEVWLKCYQIQGDARVIIANQINGDFQLAFGIPLEGFEVIQFYGEGSLQIETDSLLWNLNQWYHLAFTRSNDTIAIIIDGIEVVSGIYSGYCGNQTDLNFGFRKSTSSHPFDGEIDEVRVWNIARTQEEIQATMNTSLNGDESGLVGYWKLDEGEGDIAYDSSPNNNNGRLGISDGSDDSDPAWVISNAPIISPRTWHISVDGNDETGDGSEENPFATIQYGIDMASNEDTVLVADGHYYERINFQGKGILVASEFLIDGDSLHISNTVIDGDTMVVPVVADTGSVVCFVNEEDSTSIIKGFTIQNGVGTPVYIEFEELSTVKDIGCAISFNNIGDATPKIQELITRKYADILANYELEKRLRELDILDDTCAGAILCYDCSPVIENCIIKDNTAEHGAGIFGYGFYHSPTISGCTIVHNSAGYGGGISFAFQSDPIVSSITNCKIDSNEAAYGAGLYFRRTHANILNCRISNNLNGDGIFCHETALLNIEGCSIINNQGNGVSLFTMHEYYCEISQIDDCTISDNGGGGIACQAATGTAMAVGACLVHNNQGNGIGLNTLEPYESPYASQVDGCTITNNGGEGIYYSWGNYQANISECLVINNQGNGIVNFGRGGSSSGCTITGNGGNGIISGSGWTGAYFPIINCYVSENLGSGIYCVGDLSIMDINNNIIESNSGGGIRFESYTRGYIIDCTIRGNSADYGGGIYFSPDNPLRQPPKSDSVRSHGALVANCLIADNAATYGGGIYDAVLYYVSPASLSNCTIVKNSAQYGSGLFKTMWGQWNDILAIDNCIIAFGFQGEAIGCNDTLNIPELNCCDIFGNEGGDWVGCIAPQYGQDGNFSANPAFCDTANSNYQLASNSPCVPDNNSCDTLIGAFNVGCSGLQEFHLIFPTNDSVYLQIPPEFIWHRTEDVDYGNAAQYKLYLYDNPSHEYPNASEILSDTTYALPDTLIRSTRYYWRILAFNDYAPPRFSAETWNFYIDGYPTIPTIISPENGEFADNNTYLTWLISTDPDDFDAVSYTIQVDDDLEFNSPEIDQSGLISGLITDDAFAIQLGELEGIENLEIDTEYFWRVRADDNYGLSSDWPEILHYFVYLHQNHAPSPPTSGFTPSNSEEISTDTPTISWNYATDPDPDDNASNLSYKLQLDLDGEFETSYEYEYTTAQGINQVEVTAPLTDATQWFYRVQTIDDEGLESGWSEIQDFWVRLYNLSPLPPEDGFTPANSVEIDELLPTISWNHATDPDEEDESSTLHYILQLDSDGEFESSVAFEYTTADGINYQTLTDPLTEDMLWSYQIRTVDDGGLVSVWSQVQDFWVNSDNQSPGAPQGEFYPSNGQIVNTVYPELMWNHATDPDPSDGQETIIYNIQMDYDGEFDETVEYNYATSAGANTFTVPDPLTDGIQWYYRLQAEDDSGLTSEWTEIQDFWVNAENSPPNCPIDGFSPSNSEEVIPLTPVITWNDAIDPDPDDFSDNLKYAFRLSLDSDFAGFVCHDTTNMGINQIQPESELDDNSQYFYAVLTIDDEGLSSEWSETQNFWTNHYNYPPEPFPLYVPAPDINRVDYYTYFHWGNTVDYDPMASFDFTLQYSPDITFEGLVTSVEGLTDTSCTIRTDSLELAGQTLYWRVLAIDDDGLERIGGIPEPEVREINIIPAGDANGDGLLIGGDVTYLVGYFIGNNPAPNPPLAGDANGDCMLIGGDVSYLVQYFIGAGASPVRGNCEEPVVVSKGDE